MAGQFQRETLTASLWRVRLSRAEATTSSPRVRIGKCMLDLPSRRPTALSGEEIPLRAGEFDLLKLFEVDPSRPTSIRTVRSADCVFVPPDD